MPEQDDAFISEEAAALDAELDARGISPHSLLRYRPRSNAADSQEIRQKVSIPYWAKLDDGQ